MLHIKTATLLCVVALFVVPVTHGFDYASYKPGNLDDLLKLPKPKTGMDVGDLRKLTFPVTLESYAEKGCVKAGVIKLIMKMIPGVFPKGFADTISMSKCIKVKSDKGTVTSVAIQDKVADFLPKEVPLGTKMLVFCLLMGVSENGPAILVNEFESSAK